MTEYNGEQNNMGYTPQPVAPVENQPIPPEYQQPVAPQPAPAEYQQPVAPQPAPAQYQQPVAPQPVPAEYQQPAVAQPTPDYQAPMQIPVPPMAPQGSPEKPKKNNKPIIIGVIIAVVAIALALLIVFLGNKDDKDTEKETEKKTEQVDNKTDSDEDDSDDGEGSDKEASDKPSKDDKDDKTDKDDTDKPVSDNADAPEYTKALDAFVGLSCGDMSMLEYCFPNSFWDLMVMGFSQEAGTPLTREEVIEIMLEEIEPSEGDFMDSATYTILEEEEASSSEILKIQSSLTEIFVVDKVEEAYKLKVLFSGETDGEVDEEEMTVFVAYVDDQWLLFGENGAFIFNDF